MKTMAKNSSTKDVLLDKAQQLMLGKGFSGTSVEEICKAAKVTKGSFFHYFDSKDELAQVLIERFCIESQKKHGDFMGKNPDPLKRVYAYLDSFIRFSKDPEMAKGCLLGAFAQELSDSSPKMRAACCCGFENWAKSFAKVLMEAKKFHSPKKAVDPKSLAEHLIAVLEGSLILAKSQGNASQVEKNITHYKKYLQALFEA